MVRSPTNNPQCEIHFIRSSRTRRALNEIEGMLGRFAPIGTTNEPATARLIHERRRPQTTTLHATTTAPGSTSTTSVPIVGIENNGRQQGLLVVATFDSQYFIVRSKCLC